MSYPPQPMPRTERRDSARPVGAQRSSRRPAPRLLDQTLLGMRISTAIALVAAFVLAVVLLIAFATC